MATLQTIGSLALAILPFKTAAIGAYQECQIHGMNFSMLACCPWDSGPSEKKGKKKREMKKKKKKKKKEKKTTRLPYTEDFFFLNFEGCTLSAQLILMLIHPRFLRCLVHWFPFPSFSQAASTDPTFLVHM